MASKIAGINVKQFSAILNTVFKSKFEKDKNFTVEALKEQAFGESADLTIEDVKLMHDRCAEVLSKAAYEDWEFSQFETFLKETEFTEQQQDLFLKLWRAQRQKIHDILSKDVTWNNSLHKMSWRIDSKTKSRHVTDMNDLTAIVELNIGTEATKEKGGQIVRFEMDKQQLQIVLGEINSIQKQIAKFTTQ